MQPSHHLNAHLDLVRRRATEVESATNVPELEERWTAFLQDLERLWFKMAACYGTCSKWQPWKGRFEKLREDDQLLAYLRRARDAKEHTLEPIAQPVPDSTVLRAANSSLPCHVEGVTMRTMRGNQLFEVKGNNASVVFEPAHVRLLPARTRGKVYPPPERHLGKSIDSGDLVAIARAGLAFYESMLAQAAAYFA